MHNICDLCVLVTGGCGFVGRHLITRLKNSSGKIVIIDNLSTGNYDFVQNIQSNTSQDKHGAEIVFYKEDIRNSRAVLEIAKKEKVTHCIHLAAKIDVKESFNNPHEVIDVNIDGTLNVIMACLGSHAKNFVFASSAAVYGKQKQLPLVESMPLNPISPYGASKAACEALVSAYSSKINSTFSLRVFNIYGKRQAPTYSGVISNIKRRLETGLPPIIYGDGEQTRDFVYIDDVVTSIILAMNRISDNSISSNPLHTVLNIGTGRPVSIRYLVRVMQSIFSSKSEEVIFANPSVGDIKDSYCDIRKATNTLGFAPATRLEDGLYQIIERRGG